MNIIRLYFVLAGAGLKSQLQYRANCVMLVIMGLVWQGTGFVFIWIILNQFHNLAGWQLGDIAFLYGFRLVIHALNMLIFGIFQRIQAMVRRGEFDIFLTRPLPVFLQVMTYQFPIAAFGDLASGIMIFAAANTQVRVDWSPFALLYLFIAVIGGCFVEASVKLAISSLSFRTLSTFYLVSLFDDTLSIAGNYPLTIYGGVVRFIFTFIIPVAFLAYFPVTVILHRTSELSVSPYFAFLSPLIGFILFIFAYLCFKSELTQYQSSGH